MLFGGFLDRLNYAFIYGSAQLEVDIVDTQLEPVLILNFQVLSRRQMPDPGTLATVGAVHDKDVVHVMRVATSSTLSMMYIIALIICSQRTPPLLMLQPI